MTEADAQRLARHVELLHSYHLALWTEVEAQLQVLRAAQDEIAKLRDARVVGESRTETREAAHVLARHVKTLSGRVGTLAATVNELDTTVGELVTLLSA
jgi:hypothetical protein